MLPTPVFPLPPALPSVQYLIFELGETDDGVHTLEAMASTPPERHAEVMAEVEQVLDWARRRFPHTQGPVDDGMDWHHDLQVTDEDGWRAVTLTLAASARFADAFMAAFGVEEG